MFYVPKTNVSSESDISCPVICFQYALQHSSLVFSSASVFEYDQFQAPVNYLEILILLSLLDLLLFDFGLVN